MLIGLDLSVIPTPSELPGKSVLHLTSLIEIAQEANH